MVVWAYGQGGNDQIVGGWGPMQVDKLYGGSGDDKIWLINPAQRSLDNVAAKNYGYGGQGNDFVYGTDGADEIFGDDYKKPPTE